MTEEVLKLMKRSKRKCNLPETDDRKEYVKKSFKFFLEQNVKKDSRNDSKGAVFAEQLTWPTRT